MSLSGIFEALHQVSIPSPSLAIKEKSYTCRDISSANVLLKAKPNNQWRAKLSYFGSTKLSIEAKTTGPVYVAPEVRWETLICQTAKVGILAIRDSPL